MYLWRHFCFIYNCQVTITSNKINNNSFIVYNTQTIIWFSWLSQGFFSQVVCSNQDKIHTLHFMIMILKSLLLFYNLPPVFSCHWFGKGTRSFFLLNIWHSGFDWLLLWVGFKTWSSVPVFPIRSRGLIRFRYNF